MMHLEHILESIEKIQEFLKDTGSFEVFFEDLKTQSSVKYELLVIGEASRHLSSELKETASDTQWRAITAVRNFLAHEYFAVDLNAIWEMTQLDLPKLKNAVVRLITKLKEEK